MSDFVQHENIWYVKISYVTADQPDSKPWVTGQALAKNKVSKGTSKSGADIGVDVGQVGGRGGKYYPVNSVWATMSSIARQSAIAAFSPYLPSTEASPPASPPAPTAPVPPAAEVAPVPTPAPQARTQPPTPPVPPTAEVAPVPTPAPQATTQPTTQAILNSFAVPRPSPELLDLLQESRKELIEVAAKHAISLHQLQSSLATVSLAVDHVFNAPMKPVLPIDVAKLIKPFSSYGVTQKDGRAHCVPCNHPISATTTQNVIDHLVTDQHDESLSNSVHATKYHLAPGYNDREKERQEMQAKRDQRKVDKTNIVKRDSVAIRKENTESRKKRRKDYQTSPIPPLLSAPIQVLKAQESAKRRVVQEFMKQALVAGLPLHCTDGMLPYLRHNLKDGGWLPQTAEGLRAGYLDSVILEQDKNLMEHIIQDMDGGLTMILDEASDPAADRSPMNIIIVSHCRVHFVDTIFLNDDECCAVGVGKCVVDWWNAKFERCQQGCPPSPLAGPPSLHMFFSTRSGCVCPSKLEFLPTCVPTSCL